MRRLIVSLVVLALVLGSSDGMSADVISFEEGFMELDIVTSIETPTNQVHFSASPPTDLVIAEVGQPTVAFDRHDTPTGDFAGRFMLTNRRRINSTYEVTFDLPVIRVGLDLYDFAAGGDVAGSGSIATLTVFSDTSKTITVGMDEYVVPTPKPPDGQSATLLVDNATQPIRSAVLSFSVKDFGTAIDNISFVTVPKLVLVDIKPGTDPNSVNLESKGVLPVSIVTTNDFDAGGVDPVTVRFADPALIDIDAGHMPVEPLRWSYEDVTDDGAMDLSLKFSIPDMISSSVLGPSSLEGLLTGSTYGGIDITGSDAIRIVPQHVAIPEPSTAVLSALGLLCLTAWPRKESGLSGV